MEVHGPTAAAGTGHGHWLRSLSEGTREVTGTPRGRSSRHWNDGEYVRGYWVSKNGGYTQMNGLQWNIPLKIH